MIGAISSKKKIKKEEWENFIEKFDENKDKQIDYNEFKKMMMSFHDHFAEVEEEPERTAFIGIGTKSEIDDGKTNRQGSIS